MEMGVFSLDITIRVPCVARRMEGGLGFALSGTCAGDS